MQVFTQCTKEGGEEGVVERGKQGQTSSVVFAYKNLFHSSSIEKLQVLAQIQFFLLKNL